jgi:hypothetical protein
MVNGKTEESTEMTLVPEGTTGVMNTRLAKGVDIS